MQLTVLKDNPADIRYVESIDAALDALPESPTWDHLDFLTGGLSSPSKMPCHSWSISAKICRTGSKLRKVKGSVCSNCYALKGRYVFANVEKAHERRLSKLRDDPYMWAAAIVKSIRKTRNRYFRWHDSGDLLGVNHLHLIILIARAMPDVRFWLPTREVSYVNAIRHEIPDNLVVRVSAPMVGTPISGMLGKHTSSVGADVGFSCVAYTQDGKCGDCRACWSSDVMNVDYPLH
jgi:hypothetical protein